MDLDFAGSPVSITQFIQPKLTLDSFLIGQWKIFSPLYPQHPIEAGLINQQQMIALLNQLNLTGDL
jgi:hypothetical protein